MTAYQHIRFEQEAYRHQNDLAYLEKEKALPLSFLIHSIFVCFKDIWDDVLQEVLQGLHLFLVKRGGLML